MKTHLLPLAALVALMTYSTDSTAAPVPAPAGFREVPLWDGIPPGTPAGKLPDEMPTDDAHCAKVGAPRIWLMLPDGAASAPKPVPVVLLIPGGGYGIVGHRYEGTEVARYLKTRGIASAVLLYRCSPQVFPAPLLDARRALQVLRERGGEWGCDPARAGVMGFSAGGHLAGLLCSGVATVPASPAVARPDFSVLVYPVVRLKGPLSHGGSGMNLLGRERLAADAPGLALDTLADARWPRTYGLHDKDDPGVPSGGLELLGGVLTKQGVAVRMEIAPGRDHGFGWNRPGPDGAVRGPRDWLVRVADWILDGKK